MLAPDLPFSPQSIVGIITPLGLLGTIGAFVWKAAQWSRDRETDKIAHDLALQDHKTNVKTTLDGFGGRVAAVEQQQQRDDGRFNEMSANIERTLGAHESILRIIGEARGSSVQCREDTQALGEKIEKKMDANLKIQTDNHLDISNRLGKVEHELMLMRDRK